MVLYTRNGALEKVDIIADTNEQADRGGEILEDCPPCMYDIMGAYWTGIGICSHQSAIKDGDVPDTPNFEYVEQKERFETLFVF